MGHSNEARKQLSKYEKGELPPSERGAGAKKESGGGGGTGAMVAILVLVLAVGAGAFFMLQ